MEQVKIINWPESHFRTPFDCFELKMPKMISSMELKSGLGIVFPPSPDQDLFTILYSLFFITSLVSSLNLHPYNIIFRTNYLYPNSVLWDFTYNWVIKQPCFLLQMNRISKTIIQILIINLLHYTTNRTALSTTQQTW